MKAMHYAGSIQAKGLRIYGGWAACCSGERADRIRREGANTMVRADVTCKACLRQLARHDEYAAAKAAKETTNV